MSDWQHRYRVIKGRWPDPESPAGRNLSRHDYHMIERAERAKNVLHAVWLAKSSLQSAVVIETGEAFDEILQGVLPGILTALVVTAGTSLVGASLGAIAGGTFGLGVGAVPGAVAGGNAGFAAGVWILDLLGLAFLASYLEKNLHEVTLLLRQGFDEAWGRGARHWSSMTAGSVPRHEEMPGFSEATSASKKFARAAAVLIRLVLESIVGYLSARGPARLPELLGNLRKSKLGNGFALWVENHHADLMRNPKLLRSRGSSQGSTPVRTLATNVPEQPRPRAVRDLKQTTAKSAAAPSKAAVAIKKTKVVVDGVEVTAQRICDGAGESVTVIGHCMKAVKTYAEVLRTEGVVVNTFSGPKISRAARSELKVLSDQYGGNIPSDILEQTKTFAENRAWIESVAGRRETVVDLGNPFGSEDSVFYDMEVSIIFGGKK